MKTLIAVLLTAILLAPTAHAEPDPFYEAVAAIPGFTDMTPQKIDSAADLVCRLTEQQLDTESIADAVRLGGVAAGILRGTPNRITPPDADLFVAATQQWRCPQ